MLFSLILASTLNGGIGNNGKIPWNLKDEMDIFKQKIFKFYQFWSLTQDKS